MSRKAALSYIPHGSFIQSTYFYCQFREQVIDICTEMQKKGHAASLNLDLISADHLRQAITQTISVVMIDHFSVRTHARFLRVWILHLKSRY